jgi:hypothetical protein
MSKSSENITEDQEQPGIPAARGLLRRTPQAGERGGKPAGVGNFMQPAKIQHPTIPTTFFLFSAV